MARVIKVKLEMELVEGVHFNHRERELTDDEARRGAEWSFLDTIFIIGDKSELQEDFVQSRIVSNDN